MSGERSAGNRAGAAEGPEAPGHAAPGQRTPEARELVSQRAAAGAGPGSVPPDPRRWWALGVIGLVQLMVVLDATIVNIALPTAQSDLGIPDGTRHWAVTAYALAFGGLLILGGRVGDRLGARRVLLVGLAGFAVASVIAGAAPNGPVLFAARGLQGVFAAAMAPAALALLSTTFHDPAERGRAFGVYGALSGGGAAVGLLAGGLLTEYLDWRWCLYINAPLALAAMLGGVLWVRPNSGAVARGRLDVPGAVLSCAGLAAIVLGFAEVETRGWDDPYVLGLLVGGVALLGLLVRVEARSARPLLPLRVLVHRSRGGAFLAVGLSQVALFGFFLFITYYMQSVLGYSPVRAGLAFVPLTLAIAVGSSVVGARLLPRSGPRPLIVGGLVLAALGMASLTRIGPETEHVYSLLLLPAQLLIGLGLGLVMMPAMSTATAGVDAEEMGAASAMVNAAQQVGGALGAALLNTVAALATESHVREYPGGSGAEAAVEGYVTAIAVAAAILAATAVLTAVVLPRRGRGPASAPAEGEG